MTIIDPNAFIEFIKNNTTSKAQIIELAQKSIELIYKTRDTIEDKISVNCDTLNENLKNKIKTCTNESERLFLSDVKIFVNEIELDIMALFQCLQKFIVEQLGVVKGINIKYNYNSVEIDKNERVNKNHCAEKYYIKFNNEIVSNCSYRKLVNQVFEVLLKNNQLTQSEIEDRFDRYITKNKHGDNNYFLIDGTDLYAKTQFRLEQFKSDVIDYYDIEIEPHEELPTACGSYLCILNDNADLSVFGEKSNKILSRNKERVIYVGESNNINRRVYNNHLYKTRNSALRRSIAKLMGIDTKNITNNEETKITNWLKKNTTFKVAELTKTKEEAKKKEMNLKDKFNPYFNNR